MIDLIQVFETLSPSSTYLLSSSVPPHTLVEWRGPEKQPSEGEIDVCWEELKSIVPPEVLTVEERLLALEEKMR